jgi:hypothetical protein
MNPGLLFLAVFDWPIYGLRGGQLSLLPFLRDKSNYKSFFSRVLGSKYV